MKIRWKGYERTLIENTYLDANGQKQQRKYKEEKEFFKQEAILYAMPQGMPPGHYNYPFFYQLPAGLPGIFFDERKEWDNDKVKAAIVYKVKVFLDVPGKDLKKTERICISEALCKAPQASSC